MFRIAIVEDNGDSAKTLMDYIEQYKSENDESFDVKWFQDGEDIVTDYVPVYDIIFMDIEMEYMDGMRAAEEIRRVDKDVILIFVTNMAQYAIKGYAVDALDYLLKPLPYFAFSQQMKRSLERLKKRSQNFLILPFASGAVKLDYADIIYIESFRHDMIFHTRGEQLVYSGTMKELEKKLENAGFFRCNNCYLVNLLYVKSITGNFAMVDKYELAISRSRKKAFMEALTEYVGFKQ